MARRSIEGFFVVLVLAVIATIGAGRLWPDPIDGVYARAAALARMSGDSGAIDFPLLLRRATPNQALVCPERLCQKAKSDVLAPVFPVPADELLKRVQRVVESEPNSDTLKCAADCGLSARYVEYSPLFRFPDIIDVEVVSAGAKASTLAIYSRSVFGYWDFDVNKSRVDRWLAALKRITPSG